MLSGSPKEFLPSVDRRRLPDSVLEKPCVEKGKFRGRRAIKVTTDLSVKRVPNVAASDVVPLTFTLGGVSGTQVLFIAIQN